MRLAEKGTAIAPAARSVNNLIRPGLIRSGFFRSNLIRTALLCLALLFSTLPAHAETLEVNLKLPEIYMPSLHGDATIVSIWVEDHREIPALGRELHGKSLLPRQDMGMVLRNALVGSLRTAGFHVEPMHAKKSIDLLIHITDFTYRAEDGLLTSKAILSSRVTAMVSDGNRYLQRNLATTAEHTVVLSPGTEKIEELISETFSDTLRAILEDDKLIAALRGEPHLSD